MTEKTAQLLKALRLREIAKILDEELRNADKTDLSYQQLRPKQTNIGLTLRAQS